MAYGRLQAQEIRAHGKGYSQAAARLLAMKIRSSTSSTYDSRWRKWQQHCREHRLDAAHPTEAQVVIFLAEEYEKGADYGALNGIRSAMASAVPELRDMDDVKTALTAACKQRPPNTRYDDDMWEPEKIIELWRQRQTNEDLTEDKLREKAVSLYLMASHSRPSDTAKIATSTVRCSNERMQYKQHPGKVVRAGQGRLIRRDPIDAFQVEPHVCPVRAIQAYVALTQERRSELTPDELWLSTRRSSHEGDMYYATVGSQRISKIMLKVMQEAGIDTSIYKGGSSRAASSTAALEAGAAVDAVMKRGNWSSMAVFNRFYNRAQRRVGVTNVVFAGSS